MAGGAIVTTSVASEPPLAESWEWVRPRRGSSHHRRRHQQPARRALSSDTTLISTSIGGNDVGLWQHDQGLRQWGTTTCVSEINDADKPGAHHPAGPVGRALLRDPGSLAQRRGRDHGLPALGRHLGLVASASATPCATRSMRAPTCSPGDPDRARQPRLRPRRRGAFGNDHGICDGSSSWLHSVDANDVGSP